MEIIAQIIGFCAIGMSFLIFTQTSHKKMLILKAVQDSCWLTHYLILGCGSAAAASFLCVSRSSVFYLCDKKGVTSRIPLYIYIVLYAISAILTWKSIFSIFPALASIFSAVAFWCGNHIKTKLLTFCASSSTLVYTIAVSHSAAVYAGLAVTVSSSVLSLVQTASLKKKLEKDESLYKERIKSCGSE